MYPLVTPFYGFGDNASDSRMRAIWYYLLLYCSFVYLASKALFIIIGVPYCSYYLDIELPAQYCPNYQKAPNSFEHQAVGNNYRPYVTDSTEQIVYVRWQIGHGRWPACIVLRAWPRADKKVIVFPRDLIMGCGPRLRRIIRLSEFGRLPNLLNDN